MLYTLRYTAIFLALILVAGCASTQGENQRTDRNVITYEQLREGSYSTVYDAVSSLRPQWLRTRGADSFRSPTQVQVYLGNSRLGSIGELRNIAVNDVEYVRFYNAHEATARWGLDHGQGAIYVSMRVGS